MSNKIKAVIGISLVMLLPVLAMAQIQTAPTQPLTIERILRILNTLINWLFTLLLVVATFFIFYAAYLYLTAGGNEENVGKAKNQLIFAAVAIAVAFVAQGVRFLVEQLVQR